MRAVVFEEFAKPAAIRDVADPAPPPGGVVLRVEATGLCRSDWHGWMGHDDTISLPHVPGHEFAGVIAAVGDGVTGGWREGDRVTVPFICACGRCPACARGQQQVCERQEQPGFTHWGSFAEYVPVHHADANLIALPDGLSYATAAALGCRFATAYRAVLQQGRLRAGEWVAVHGCGGVGLSAVMIAAAAGARVVAVDISAEALRLAHEFGAAVSVNAADGDAATAVRDATGGGAHLSLDTLGSDATCAGSVASLRRQGRHVQVGWIPQGTTPVPMGLVMGQELELIGSHGMAAHAYPEMLRQVTAGALRPQELIAGTIDLDAAPEALAELGHGFRTGVTVIAPSS
ncbi:zinc-dependent alcohol dehydrogenase family protein [Streptomyces sp. A7024]|uniref:2-deoxy-scyllo-inosamine dehydrogenase n=1 Tax=Streptomyces coryli TaxID=1128680 RepID=A0A6G4U6F0_9ACTN|nr:zinc-dependent alcohol dehydrogenase family protein [Streptomyces coryli]NGN66771.1 zinc-dependent alcohol dehydrogenase family protein [Streptomyces coryli]